MLSQFIATPSSSDASLVDLIVVNTVLLQGQIRTLLGPLLAQGFAAELTDAFEVIPVVTGGELVISGLVFTRLVPITAHARKIDANRHTMANKPV